MHRIAVSLAALVLVFAGVPNTRAQDQDTDDRLQVIKNPEIVRQINQIEIGTSIKEVKSRLKARAIQFSGDNLARIMKDPDDAYLSFTVDPEYSFAVVDYSRRSQKVTRLTLVIYPPGRPQKAYRSWLPLRNLQWFDDGSYAIHFEKPLSK